MTLIFACVVTWLALSALAALALGVFLRNAGHPRSLLEEG